MGSVNVNLGALHKKVAQLCSGRLDEWVCAYVGSIYSTGGNYTYIGCSKPVYGGATSNNWLCRKKLSTYDKFPEECLNHNHRHEGKCCPIEEGIKCYRFAVRLVDESGELEALIWAPAIHLLAVRPEEFDAMTPAQREEIFQGLQGKEWRFNILSVVDELGFRQFKVQFLMPSQKAYVIKQPRSLAEMMDLPRMANLFTNPSSNGVEHTKSSGTPGQRGSGNPLVLQPKGGSAISSESSSESLMRFETEKDLVPALASPSPTLVPVDRDQRDIPPSQALRHLKLSLESLVTASQQNTKAIEQLALAVSKIQKQFT